MRIYFILSVIPIVLVYLFLFFIIIKKRKKSGGKNAHTTASQRRKNYSDTQFLKNNSPNTFGMGREKEYLHIFEDTKNRKHRFDNFESKEVDCGLDEGVFGAKNEKKDFF